MACIFAARAWLGGIDRAGEDGVAYLRGQRCHSSTADALELGGMISKLCQYRESSCCG
jgi:hypothetical protein